MNATSTGGLARERQATGASPVLRLHGHPLERNMARAVTAEAVGTFVLAVLAAGLGPISGAHLNPAVTLGLAANGRFPWSYAPAYLAAQFGGAVGAAAVTWILYGAQARTRASLGATYPATGVSAARVCVAEGVVTFVLVLVIISVAPTAGFRVASPQ